MWKSTDPEGNEAAKVRARVAVYLNGKGLDLGCGPWRIAPNNDLENNCIGVDTYPEADVVCNIAKLDFAKDEIFDYAFSSHALEDIFYTEAALREWWRVLKVGGRLLLYLPLSRLVAKEVGLDNWEEFYPDKGTAGANPAHKHDYSPSHIQSLMEKIGHAELEVDEIHGEGTEYSFLQVYKKLSSINLPINKVTKPNGKSKRALVVRYGAFGDMIMSTPVIRLIKQQGYHVTVNCTTYGAPVLEHNPYVDAVAIQQKDFIPNVELEDYWKEISKGYDLFVNLSESVEGDLLIPDRKAFEAQIALKEKYPNAPDTQIFEEVVKVYRKLVGDKNYYDAHLAKAGLPERGLCGELYFSPSEELVAQDFRNRYKDFFLIIWSLSGSAYHKIYPYFQPVVQQLLTKIPNALIVSVGDNDCRLAERSESARYLPRAGEWKIRASMLMTKYADLVIGPETGVLNAAGCFKTPKITLLSHSNHTNLCQYWENDYCLAPENTFCYPCHMLHYTHECGENTWCKFCGVQHFEGKCEWGSQPHIHQSCPYGEVNQDEFRQLFTVLKEHKVELGLTNKQLKILEPKANERIPDLPLCVSGGIMPERLVARVMEVYENRKHVPSEPRVNLVTLNA